MPKKSKASEYTVLIGCNVETSEDDLDGKRYEAGDVLRATEVLSPTIDTLLEMNAIEVKE